MKARAPPNALAPDRGWMSNLAGTAYLRMLGVSGYSLEVQWNERDSADVNGLEPSVPVPDQGGFVFPVLGTVLIWAKQQVSWPQQAPTVQNGRRQPRCRP